MSQTKRDILKKSLQLFNEKGIDHVALRDISNEMGISVGNLQYHFKKREDIVESLYFALVERIEEEILGVNPHRLIHDFLDLPVRIVAIFYEYRFFLIDFVSITRNSERIKTHYSHLSQKREEQFAVFIQALIDMNVLREPILKDEYKHFFKTIELVSNFWFSSSLIRSDNLSDELIEGYSIQIGQILFPYLTEEGRSHFSDVYALRLLPT